MTKYHTSLYKGSRANYFDYDVINTIKGDFRSALTWYAKAQDKGGPRIVLLNDDFDVVTEYGLTPEDLKTFQQVQENYNYRIL